MSTPDDVKRAFDAAYERMQAENPPTVTIERAGRWTYYLKLTDGLTLCGSWFVLGAERARRVAQRKLARYLKRKARRESFGTERVR